MKTRAAAYSEPFITTFTEPGFWPVVLPSAEPVNLESLDSLRTRRRSENRREVASFLEPLNRLATESHHLTRRLGLGFRHEGGWSEIPHYQFMGPRGGGDAVRIGVFATIHGDEPESGLGLIRFLEELVRRPELAAGFVIEAYPVCNPLGFEDGTRTARTGRDLNREFWRDSDQPEVRLLEGELVGTSFHGLVSLHCDDTSHGLYGFLSGRRPSEVLSASLLEPALSAAERHLPRNQDARIDGFNACAGILRTCYDGVLRAPEGMVEPPFEITFETPQLTPVNLQVEAFSTALIVMLEEYRQLMAHAPNL